jgi:DNA-binding SARP family transcriptional activator
VKIDVISTDESKTLTFHPSRWQVQSLQVPGLALIDLLGKPRVVLADGSQHMLSGKTAALVALIAIERAPSCQRVAGMLWPESPESLARNNLRTLRHRLTDRLGVEMLHSSERLSISPQVATSRSWNADELAAMLIADGLARCTFLADIALLQLEQFQDWLAITRQRIKQQQLSTVSTALSIAMTSNQTAAVISFARACVTLEPLSEHWHRQLMNAHMACGDRAAALAAYSACVDILRDNFGVTPDARTLKLQLSIMKNDNFIEPLVIESAALTRCNTQLEPL